MSSEIIQIIREQVKPLFANVSETFDAVTDTLLAKECAGIPIWQHFHHMLHSLDQWFINPSIYTDPQFHEMGLSSLDKPGKGFLSKSTLGTYFENIKIKINGYLETLTDDDLTAKPERSEHTRLKLIMAQSRHLMYHIGFIHACIKELTGKWPEYIGISRPNPYRA